MTTNAQPDRSATGAGGRQPAEGRDDLGIPGADRGIGDVPTEGGAVDEKARRDYLGERTDAGRPTPAGEVESDVLPEVEVPEHEM